MPPLSYKDLLQLTLSLRELHHESRATNTVDESVHSIKVFTSASEEQQITFPLRSILHIDFYRYKPVQRE